MALSPPVGSPARLAPFCPVFSLAVPAFSECSCDLRWEISSYGVTPALLRADRERDSPSLELGMPPFSLHHSWPHTSNQWGLCSVERWELVGRAAEERSPNPYYILKCNNSTMSIFVDGTDHFWKRPINLKQRGNNLAKVMLRQNIKIEKKSSLELD